MIGNSDNETNFPHKSMLTNRQVANLRKVFANQTSTYIKLSKAQLSKMIQLGRFLGRILSLLLRTGSPLMKNIIQPLAKSVLIPLELTAAASVTDAGIHKKILGFGHNTTLIISNCEMKDILKIVKSFERKEQKRGFLSMLLGILGASLLGNMLTGKGVMRAGEGTVRVVYGSKRSSLKDV